MDLISAAALEAVLSDVEVPVLQTSRNGNGVVPKASALEVFRNYKDVIPRALVSKLGAKRPAGDRSKVLWSLTCKLLEAGLQPGEVVILLEGTVWNKFGHDRSRLWADVNKAALRVSLPPPNQNRASENNKTPGRSQKSTTRESWAEPLDRYLAVETQDPRWMIDGLWTDKSHGIIAGEPKTRKSYLAIDIALSVATGTKCLDHFEVKRSCPVLMIQEEISDSEMRKRLRYIAEAKGLGGKVEKTSDGLRVRLPDPIPLFLRNRKQFDLTKTECMEELLREIQERHIGLIILDPLQWMLGEADENKTASVRPILQNLLALKESTGTGIMIVHHYAKSSAQNPRNGGQRMTGSHAFHGWVESALYLSKPEPFVTKVEREFRTFEPLPDFEVEFGGGEEGYRVSVQADENIKKPEKRTKLDEYVRKNPGMSVQAIARLFKVTDRTILRHVEASKHIKVVTERGSTGRPRNVLVWK